MATRRDKRATLLQQAQQTLRQREVAPVHQQLAAVLDGLDGWGVLAAACDRAPRHAPLYGPRVVRRADAVAVVVWHKGPGFHGYRALTLFGVWATADGRLLVGGKQVAYSAATYNPESYHKLIRTDYRTYYTDDGAPPPTPLWAVTYTPAERLALRRELAAVVGGYAFPR